MGERFDWDRYEAAFDEARLLLRYYGRESVNGKDAHDFAIYSLRQMPWFRNRVRFDIIDAFRSENGRGRSTARFQQYHRGFDSFVGKKGVESDSDWFDQYEFLTDRQKEIAWLYSAGFTTREIAVRLGISVSATSAHKYSIAERILKFMPFKSQSQRGWMYANEPEMAKRWEKETPKGKKLPVKVEEKKKWKRSAK